MNTQEQIIEAVKNAVRDFLEGGDTNDAALLEKVIHTDYQNVQDGFFGEPGIFTFSKEEYKHLVETKRFGGSPRTVDFASLEVLGNLAVARVHLESAVLRFTSYIVAVRDGGRWLIRNNFPSIVPKNA
ncbi:nuclear transport factor 2 family protein [Dawidia soli]|uniref:Nuclear transport factor 2 family protein n=1 Tax=Dawidia soli TaxID=2782352 RepID=A0AAP2D9M9_9BACT|nr:nuclear transport factor 2 family protein [Dawidia soli]